MLFEGLIVIFDMGKILMHIQAVMGNLDDTACDIGTMVGNAF